MLTIWAFIWRALVGLGVVLVGALLVSWAMHGMARWVKRPMPKLRVAVVDVLARILVALVVYLLLWIMLAVSVWALIYIGQFLWRGGFREKEWLKKISWMALFEFVPIPIVMLLCLRPLFSVDKPVDSTNLPRVTPKECERVSPGIMYIEMACSFWENMLGNVKRLLLMKKPFWFGLPLAIAGISVVFFFKGPYNSGDEYGLSVYFCASVVALVVGACWYYLPLWMIEQACHFVKQGELVLCRQARCMADTCLHDQPVALHGQEMSHQVEVDPLGKTLQGPSRDLVPNDVLAKFKEPKEVENVGSVSSE